MFYGFRMILCFPHNITFLHSIIIFLNDAQRAADAY